MRTQQVRDHGDAGEPQHIAGEHARDNRQPATHQWAFDGPRKYAFRLQRRR
jgi:hypothetical protein